MKDEKKAKTPSVRERENSSHNVVEIGIRHTVRRPIKTYMPKTAINVGRENLCAHATLHACKCDLSIRITNGKKQRQAMNKTKRKGTVIIKMCPLKSVPTHSNNAIIIKMSFLYMQATGVRLLPRYSRNITAVLFPIIKVR